MDNTNIHNKLKVKTKYPVIRLAIVGGYFLFSVLVFLNYLLYNLHIGFLLINMFFLIIFYIDLISSIRIYTFYENQIHIHAPFRLYKRLLVLNVKDIKRVTYVSIGNSLPKFKIELYNALEYFTSFHHNIFWNNYFDFAIDYFKKHNIEILRMKDFGGTVAYDIRKRRK